MSLLSPLGIIGTVWRMIWAGKTTNFPRDAVWEVAHVHRSPSLLCGPSSSCAVRFSAARYCVLGGAPRGFLAILRTKHSSVAVVGWVPGSSNLKININLPMCSSSSPSSAVASFHATKSNLKRTFWYIFHNYWFLYQKDAKRLQYWRWYYLWHLYHKKNHNEMV